MTTSMSAVNCPACDAPTFVGVTEDGCPLRVDESPAAGGNMQRLADVGRPVMHLYGPEGSVESDWSQHLELTNSGYPVMRVYSPDESAGRTDLHWAHCMSCTAPVKPSSVEDILAWQAKWASDENPKENDHG